MNRPKCEEWYFGGHSKSCSVEVVLVYSVLYMRMMSFFDIFVLNIVLTRYEVLSFHFVHLEGKNIYWWMTCLSPRGRSKIPTALP
jgi:hypothetical protein